MRTKRPDGKVQIPGEFELLKADYSSQADSPRARNFVADRNKETHYTII